MSTQVRKTSSTRACLPGTMSCSYAGGCALRQSSRSVLFRERELNVFVWEDGANFYVSAKGADVITQCSEFDFGALFEAGNFALLDLHGEREFSLSHFTVLTQFIKCHAIENGVGALFGADAAGLGHQLVS